MTREYPGYHDVHERLADWRREILTRTSRPDDLRLLPTFNRVNLAAASEAVIRVDSFLGTTNTERVQDVYFPPLCVDTGRPDLQSSFSYENPAHPVLTALRRRFPLEAIAGTGTDFERALRLRDWIKSLFPHFMPYRMPAWNALTILDRGERGTERFLCVHYTVSLVQTCLSLGIQARIVNLHHAIADDYVIGEEANHTPPIDEHVVAEIWSREQSRWIMLDTDYDCHFERNGLPQSAWEVHLALVSNDLASLDCVRGPGSHAYNAYAEPIEDDTNFFGLDLPSYYAHVSVLMRNNFLSDPDGPVPVIHLTDPSTPPILWHGGSDLRLQPHLLGPVVVAAPYTDKIAILSDGNCGTGWSSSDAAVQHWVECLFGAPRRVGEVALCWPEYDLNYRSSRYLRLDRLTDEAWVPIESIEIDPEGPFTKHSFPPIETGGIRIFQEVGGGHPLHPNRLWLNQVEVFDPAP